MLDDRKTAILSAVVQEYIATAQPGGFDPHRRRARRAGVVGDRAQRDGRARAGGLPRPAAHVGRAHPDRQGLPLLRRPPRRARAASTRRRSARSATSSAPPTAGWRRCSTARPTCSPTLTNYAAVVVGPRPAAVEVRSVQIVGLSSTRGDGRRRARQRHRRERADRARRRRQRRPPRRGLGPPRRAS